jgi:hypothetical protein
MRYSRLASPVPCAALRRTLRLPPRLALRTVKVQPPRCGIELYAGVKLRVSERPLGPTSRLAHVATVCFMYLRCMLHMFHLDIIKIDLVLHMLQ